MTDTARWIVLLYIPYEGHMPLIVASHAEALEEVRDPEDVIIRGEVVLGTIESRTW